MMCVNLRRQTQHAKAGQSACVGSFFARQSQRSFSSTRPRALQRSSTQQEIPDQRPATFVVCVGRRLRQQTSCGIHQGIAGPKRGQVWSIDKSIVQPKVKIVNALILAIADCTVSGFKLLTRIPILNLFF
jgi:hypothetical protein